MKITDAHITGGFWLKRKQKAAHNVLWRQLEILKGSAKGLRPEQCSPVVENFKIAAGTSNASYQGRVYSDSELGKWMEAAAYSLRHFPDVQLEEEMDELVALICAAQMPDGYLNTYFQVLHPESRLKHFAFSCELYNMGHLMEAAVAYHAVTGKKAFLDAMCRAADLLCSMIGPDDGQLHVYDGHAEIELGLLKLYEATARSRYLKLATYFVIERGKQPCFYLTEELLGDNDTGANDKWFGPDHHQAHMPICQQRFAEGHAVKVTYLYSAVTELAARGQDPNGNLSTAACSIWSNMVNRRMYITGAIGSQGYAERFTVDDDLPSDRGYAETCASVGICLWGKRMLALRRDGAIADTMERALYNGMLAGWSLEGNAYFYVNMLHSKPSVTGYREDEKHVTLERSPWFECACCPSNLLRIVTNLESYLFSVQGDTLYLDGYAQSDIHFSHGSQTGTLHLQTEYPYSGHISIRFDGANLISFILALRIPGWCKKSTLSINGDPVQPKEENGYAVLDRAWTGGDCVEFDLEMSPRYLSANPKMWDVQGRAALTCGPLVYCVEAVDHDSNISGLQYRSDASYMAVSGTGILADETVLLGNGLRRNATNKPYEVYNPNAEPCTVQAIPYFAWGNRGVGDMDVWLPIR